MTLPPIQEAPVETEFSIDALLRNLYTTPGLEIRHAMGDIKYRLRFTGATGPDTERVMDHRWSDVIMNTLRKGYLLNELPVTGLDFVYTLSPRGHMRAEFPVSRNPPSPFDSIETLCHMARAITVEQVQTMSEYGKLGYLSNDVAAFLSFRQELLLIDEQEQGIANQKQ